VRELDFDGYVDVLRERIFDYEVIHDDGTLPDFGELMADYENAPGAWPDHAYDELMTQGHLDPSASGKTMGPNAFARLSADGRYYVRQQRKGA
jgi:hypothetical protein